MNKCTGSTWVQRQNWSLLKKKTKRNGREEQIYSLHDSEAKKKDLYFLSLIKPSLKIEVECRQSRSNKEPRTTFVFPSNISFSLMSPGSRHFTRFDC